MKLRFLRGLALCAAALSLAGCDDAPTDPIAASVRKIELVGFPGGAFITGATVAANFRATDEGGRPVAGAELRFRVESGGGVVTDVDTTDAEGIATPAWVLGTEGNNKITVSMRGSSAHSQLSLTVGPAPVVTFDRDSLVFAGPGCYTEVSFGVSHSDVAGAVAVSRTDTTMLSFFVFQARSGGQGERFRGTLAEKPGTSLIVAKPTVGVPDTIRVRVLDAKSRISHSDWFPTPGVMRLGAQQSLQMRTDTPCGDRSHPNDYGTADTVSVRLANLTPGTVTLSAASVLPHSGSSSVNITGKAAGPGMVVASYRGGVDTVRFIVQ